MPPKTKVVEDQGGCGEWNVRGAIKEKKRGEGWDGSGWMDGVFERRWGRQQTTRRNGMAGNDVCAAGRRLERAVFF